MRQRTYGNWGLGLVLTIGFCFLACPKPVLATTPENGVRVGLVDSMFRDIPEPMVKMLMIPFRALVYAQTGIQGEITATKSAFELADKMENKQIQFGVFHGYEYAWIQEKYPNLKPLMIVINRHKELSASLITRNDNDGKSLSDFRGGKLGMPKFTREHCWLWLERHCEDIGSAPDAFFSEICRHSNPENAMDDILRGKISCMVADSVSLECYKRVKPGCFNRLKVVKQSEVFPAAVIVYREGFVDSQVVSKFRSGMINANKNERSRELMMMWKLTGFEPIPDNYQATLAAIRRTYPAPDVQVKTAATRSANAEMED